MNIVLVGFRGAGKSTIAKALNEKLNMQLISTDELIIEREKSTIKEIIENKGWKYFRELESQIILEISDMDNCIIDTGAGIIENEMNISELKKHGFIVFLNVSVKDAKFRISKSPNRPKLNPLLNFEDDMIAAYNRRLPLYKEALDLEVNTSKTTIENCVKNIIEAFESY